MCDLRIRRDVEPTKSHALDTRPVRASRARVGAGLWSEPRVMVKRTLRCSVRRLLGAGSCARGATVPASGQGAGAVREGLEFLGPAG